MIFSRRQFMQSGATVVAAGASVPAMLMNLAAARAAENDKSTKDRVLVVFELNGGNDGINTLVPFKDPAYAKLRPTLAIPEKDLHVLDAATGVGLHPSMEGFAQLFKNKNLAVIQGAGYPHANRSHFRSMEIWHRGSPENSVTTGFLGRYYETALSKENTCAVPIIHYGKNRPEIFKAGKAPAMSVNAIDDFYPMNQKPESVAISTLYKNMKGADPAMMPGAKPDDVLSPSEIVQATGMDIVKGTEIIKGILKNPRTPKTAGRGNWRTIWNASMDRAALPSKGRPNDSNSARFHPAPRPRVSRPRLISSRVAAIFARTGGWRNAVQATSGPSLIPVVAVAIAARSANASRGPRSGPSSR